MSFPDRLRMVIKQSGLKRDQFADKSKKSRNQIFKYLNGENLPTADFFQAVKSEFPWVNIEWFVTGVGDMYSSVPVGLSLQDAGDDQVPQMLNGDTSELKSIWNENKFINIMKIRDILADYLAPKIIQEIEEKLRKEI